MIGEQSITASMPWDDRWSSRYVPSDHKPHKSALHYRGWTLVDVGRWRYASKDGSEERMRVCKANGRHADALREFRRVVDERMSDE